MPTVTAKQAACPACDGSGGHWERRGVGQLGWWRWCPLFGSNHRATPKQPGGAR